MTALGAGPPGSAPAQELIDAGFAFEVADAADQNANLVFSPFSVGVALTMTSAGAGGDTAALDKLARATGGAVFSVTGASEVAAAATAHKREAWELVSVLVPGAEDIVAIGIAGEPLDEMHPRTGRMSQRFGHEGGAETAAMGHGANHLPHGHDLIGHADAAGGEQIEFLLARSGFMMRAANAGPDGLQRGNDLVAGGGSRFLS